jgi:hypothetical protein
MTDAAAAVFSKRDRAPTILSMRQSGINPGGNNRSSRGYGERGGRFGAENSR